MESIALEVEGCQLGVGNLDAIGLNRYAVVIFFNY
jgi:hypothetical protein